MAAYTDADLEVALEAYFKKHSGLARDCVEAALDAVAPAIAARAWDEGHGTPWQREIDDCRCGAWNRGECGCGKYGTGRLVTPNPHRADEIERTP